MIKRYAIDTSILVRLLTGHPAEEYEALKRTLDGLLQNGARLCVTSMVVGEAYVALQHHYKFEKRTAREALYELFSSRYVNPIDGEKVLKALLDFQGAGFMDRLIAICSAREGMTTLTLDRKMGKLPDGKSINAL